LTALVNEPVYSNSNDIFEGSNEDSNNAFSAMFRGSASTPAADEEEKSVAEKLKEKVDIIPY